MLQIEGVVAGPQGNLFLQVALLLRAASLTPEAVIWTSTSGGNLVKIQILLHAADGHQSAILCKDLLTIPEIAHVVACEMRHAWIVPRLPTHVPFHGRDRTQTPEPPSPQESR